MSQISRQRLLASTLLAGFALSAPAFAQANETPGAPAASTVSSTGEPSENEQIVVTGSRIASPTLTSPSPLQLVDMAQIRSTGAANLQDVLLQNPVFGTPSISRTNSNFQTSGVGLATIDLRNLGTSRTLVLVNGRRFVSGSPNDQAVDLNTIPTSFIERVDVLTGGASSIYGSDAVAGVVNIVYRTDFQGIEMNAQKGISQYGDNAQTQLNATMGSNFADGKGNVMVYAGYSRDGAVLSKGRGRSAVDQLSVGASTGVVGDIFTASRPSYSSFAPQGRFFGAGGATVGTFDANNNFITGFSTNGTAARAADGFNRSAYRTIAVPVERYLIATRANYEIIPEVTAFLEGTFAKSHTASQLEPFPLSSSGTGGVFQGQGGYFPVEQRVNGVLFANPYVPTALLSRLTDTNGDGLRDVSFTRRMTDIANRTAIADRTTYRIVAGVEGKVLNDWHYELYYNYGRTDDNQTSTGQVNLANFRSALSVVPVAVGTPGAVTYNGSTFACADLNARAQGCIPVNIFGRNTITPAAAAYVRADGNRQAYASQQDVGLNINGNLWDLWGAGPIGLAFGGEYRKEASSAVNDSLTQAGLNGGNAIPNTSGSFDVKEAYVEGRIPLLTDKPFFKNLEARAAGRVSNYSTIGTVYSWNYGGEYSPTSDVTFRVVKARATRAPNVTELYQGLSQTFPTGLIDPCVGVTATSTGATAANCRAATGVNANIAANGVFTQTPSDIQGVSGYDGGNPSLKQESADTFTAGVAVNPRSIHALRNFSFTVDYSRTKIRGAIVSTPRQFILQQCYQFGNPLYCGFVTRRATIEGSNSAGSLQFVNSGASNSGGVLNSNIDATVNYRQDMGDLGLKGILDLSVAYTRVLKYYQIPLPGADKDYIGGEVGASKDRFLVTANYKIGGFSINYRGTYIGKAYLDDQFVNQLTEADGVTPIDRHDPRVAVGAKYYSDLQLQADVGDHYQVYFGVNNLFNVSPPPIISGLPADQTGTETDSGTYDAIGRRFYAGARLRF